MKKTFEQLVEEVEAGQHQVMVVEAASGPLGADRHDVSSEQEKLAAFNEVTAQISSYDGSIGPDWVGEVAADLAANPDKADELLAMAEANLGRYERLGYNVVDRGGSAELWQKIQQGIIATRTDEIPRYRFNGA